MFLAILLHHIGSTTISLDSVHFLAFFFQTKRLETGPGSVSRYSSGPLRQAVRQSEAACPRWLLQLYSSKVALDAAQLSDHVAQVCIWSVCRSATWRRKAEEFLTHKTCTEFSSRRKQEATNALQFIKAPQFTKEKCPTLLTGVYTNRSHRK